MIYHEIVKSDSGLFEVYTKNFARYIGTFRTRQQAEQCAEERDNMIKAYRKNRHGGIK